MILRANRETSTWTWRTTRRTLNLFTERPQRGVERQLASESLQQHARRRSPQSGRNKALFTASDTKGHLAPSDFCRASDGSVQGPLAQLLGSLQSRQPRQKRSESVRTSSETQPSTSGRASKLLFLTELEISGDPHEATRLAGCSFAEVCIWRRDPMFARDYVLAIATHLKALKRMVQEIADSDTSTAIRQQAYRLLESEAQHVDTEGRIDARRWRDTLTSFTRALNLDVANLGTIGTDYKSKVYSHET